MLLQDIWFSTEMKMLPLLGNLPQILATALGVPTSGIKPDGNECGDMLWLGTEMAMLLQDLWGSTEIKMLPLLGNPPQPLTTSLGVPFPGIRSDGIECSLAWN
jgi:hypothetical protein